LSVVHLVLLDVLLTRPRLGVGSGDVVGRLADLRIGRPADLQARRDQPTG
jgi:hypothetical protein